MRCATPSARAAIALLAWLSVALPAAGPAAAGDRSVQLKKWIEGPVRYIALKEEAKKFKSLDTDEDRSLFIERFWARRDPSPETLTNEYRQLFWERVQQANELFLDSPKDGALTDRGKIYILYGPPTEIEEDIHRRTERPGSTPGILRWIYEGRPSGRMDVNPVVVVPFERDAGGEYKVSYDPKLASVFFDPLAVRERHMRDVEQFYDILGVSSRSELSVMLDLGRMQEVPPQEQVLLERVETIEAYNTHAVRAELHRYYLPEPQQSLVSVTVDISDTAPGEKPAIIARFTHRDATRQPRLLGEDSFRVVQVGDTRVAQGRLSLDPGHYDVTLLVADPVKVRTGLLNIETVVPEPSDRLRLSDVAWASELESLPYASLVSYDEPYIVGPFRVVPRLGATFRPGETVRLFYEIYGASYPVRVSYRLQGREDDGTWVDLGLPATAQQSASSQGWDLPTSERWPPGDYRIRIEARDSDGTQVERSVPFVLGAPSSS